MRSLVFAAFCVVACGGFGAEYAKVAFAFDYAAEPTNKSFGVVADLVAKRIAARTAPSDAAGPLVVRLALDSRVKGENAIVTVKAGRAEIRAGRFRGLVFGAGLLLRTARYGERTFSLADGEYRFEPKKSLRMCYLARHFLNWYHLATPEELTTYIDDLVLWGHNAFNVPYSYPTPGKNGNFEQASVAVVTNNFHTYRALRLALAAFSGPVYSESAEFTWILLPHYLVRESVCSVIDTLRGNMRLW